MGWQDREYRTPRDEGGFRRAMRRVFGGDGNFLNWSFPLFTVAGIRVSIHFLFLIYILVQLIVSFQPGRGGPVFTAIHMAVLFVIVLLHEFGHCIACRKVGGEASSILMWPLGGLASCNPPHHPRASLITTLGGPFVHVLLAPVIVGLLVLSGVPWQSLLFQPFDPWSAFYAQAAPNNAIFYLRYTLFTAHVMNAALFCFNMLLVMFPMDAGRVLQEILWFRLGHRRSMQIAVNVGLFMAVAVGIFALTTNTMLLMTIAIFCGFTCWQQRMQLAFMEPELYSGTYDYRPRTGRDRDAGGVATRVRTEPTKSELRKEKEQQEILAEVDRILEKIRTQGMASLTKKEVATLKGETERKRRESGAR